EIVIDHGRSVGERERAIRELRAFGQRLPELAWRDAAREPLRAHLVELGLYAATFDADFDEAPAALVLDMKTLVHWSMKAHRLRFVRECGGDLRAELARVTGADVACARTDGGWDVALGPHRRTVADSSAMADVCMLLAEWAARCAPGCQPIYAEAR